MDRKRRRTEAKDDNDSVEEAAGGAERGPPPSQRSSQLRDRALISEDPTEAAGAVLELRQSCIESAEPEVFNGLLRRVRRRKRAVWDLVTRELQIGPIHSGECAASKLSEEDALAFLTAEEAADGAIGRAAISERGLADVQELAPSWSLMDLEMRPLARAFRLDRAVPPGTELLVLCDYQFDLPWLFGECPALLQAARLLVVHGDAPAVERANRQCITDLQLEGRVSMYRPPLPIAYGTHHTKLMLCYHRAGLRVVVHTANMVASDWKGKTQGMYVRDFPAVAEGAGPVESEFASYLGAYLRRVGAPLEDARKRLAAYDCSGAGVALVASVPGRHVGDDLHRFGHMRLRRLLSRERFAGNDNAPIVCQYSSLGSLQEGWLFDEFGASLASSAADVLTSRRRPTLQLVWPTIEQVRTSIMGYASGGSLPCSLRNLKPFLHPLLHKWDGTASNRADAMPHIKTFFRYRGTELLFCVLTSANLSSAAWGKLEKSGRQLMVRSYELGVLFIPSLYTRPVFSLDERIGRLAAPAPRRVRFIAAFADDSGKGTSPEEELGKLETVSVPVPFRIPPAKYDRQDRPWFWDGQFTRPDIFGQTWPPAAP